MARVELLRGLVKLANQLQSSLALDAIVHVIAMALSDTFGFREASVYLRDADGDFAVHATVGESPDFDRMLFERPSPEATSGTDSSSRSTRSAHPLFVDHRRHQWTDEQLYYLPELDIGPRDSGEWNSNDDLFVPLWDKDHELMGVLDLYDPADRRLPTLELVKSLEVFATHAAVAIENARQYEALEETSAQLKAQLALRHAILEVSGALLATLEPREVFARIATLLREIVDHDALEVRLVDEETQELYSGYCSDEDAADGAQIAAWRSPRGCRCQRLGRAPQRGTARQRHAERPARSARARHREGAAGEHHRPPRPRRPGARRARAGPAGRTHLHGPTSSSPSPSSPISRRSRSTTPGSTRRRRRRRGGWKSSWP